MSGTVTTFISGGQTSTTVVIPSSAPMKLPTSSKTSFQSGTKSRVKNTPRRGKPPGSSGTLTSLREPALYTQASRNSSDAVATVARPAPTPNVPVIFNSQPCSVLLVSEPAQANVPSILVSGPTSQSTNVQTFISSAGELAKPREAKVVYADAPLLYTTANSTQMVVQSPASNPKPPDDVKHEILPTTFQTPKPKPTKPRPDVSKNKPVRPKTQTHNSMVIDLPSTPSNFVESLTFHTDNSVEAPTSVGYTINITDILPPKPSPQKSPLSPKMKTAVQKASNCAQSIPALPQKAQLFPKEAISVKCQSKMIAAAPPAAPPAALKLPSPSPMNMGTQSTSYIQFQTSSDSDDLSVITILSSPGQQPISLDPPGIHNTHFLSQVPVPQLVPYQTSPVGSPSKLSKETAAVGMRDAVVDAMDVVEVIDVASNDATLRVPISGTHIGELHHGLTRNVPEPYANDILSQLTPDGSLPAISSSQVSSVLSALDSPQQQQHQDIQHAFHDPNQAQPPKETNKTSPPARKTTRKNQPKETVKRKKKDETESQNTNQLVERVQCFKCRFCLFLTLDSAAVTKHIQEEHSSHLSKSGPNGSVIPCPGCSNVFVSEKSLSVHLSEDHKVALRELNDIMSTLTATPSKEDPPVEDDSKKKAKPMKERAKRSPKTSAKIRVRNLMKDEAPAQAVESEAPLGETGTPVEPAGKADGPHVRDDLDDHDYATVIRDDSDDDSDDENAKKRRKRTKGGAARKKRKTNSENDQSGRFVVVNYKCSVAGCGVKMRSCDNLVYHQRCHKKGEAADAKCPTNEEARVEGQGEGDKTPPAKSRKLEFACPECDLSLRSWVYMSGHLWRSHNIDMELHSCDQCDYKTPSFSNMINLHKRIHGSERPFACDSCDKSFKTTKQLRNHKVVHANQERAAAGGASGCEECGRLFADARLLRSHVSAVHKKLKPFTCPTCGYAASNRSTLKMHARLHTGEKPFACDVCTYSTSDHNSLRRHKKRHSGEKPYKCPHCFYACIQSSTYKVHIRTKHPGQGEGLMYSCPSCPFHTVSFDIFRTHSAQHREPNETTDHKIRPPEKKQPKVRIKANNDRGSHLAVAAAAVSEPLPIILSFSTEDGHASEAPHMHSVVEEVSEAIIPGSDLHLLYSNFAGFGEPQTTEVTAGVVYGSQTSDFVMSMLGDSVIQVVNERNNDNGHSPLVSLAEERITGDLGELQENTEDLKFKLCEDVRS